MVLDIGPIKAQYAALPESRRRNDPQVLEALAFIAEIERLTATDELGDGRCGKCGATCAYCGGAAAKARANYHAKPPCPVCDA